MRTDRVPQRAILLLAAAIVAGCGTVPSPPPPAAPTADNASSTRPAAPSGSIPTRGPNPQPTPAPTQVPAATSVVTTPGRFLAISADEFGAGGLCGLRLDGTLRCWQDPGGGDEDPEAWVPEGRLVSLDVGPGGRCGLRENGSIACSSSIAPPGTYLDVGASQDVTCALRTDGRIVCWRNAQSEGPEPKAVSGTYTALDVGDGIACGIRTTGRLQCWSLDPEIAQIRADGGIPGRVRAISITGYNRRCAIGTDRSLRCVGKLYPFNDRPPTGRFRMVAGNDSTTCAIRTDGTLACWGAAERGGGRAMVPRGQFTDVAVSGAGTCAIRRGDQALLCWGGMSGEAMDAAGVGLNPDVLATEAVEAIDVAGGATTCIVRQDHTLGCWGSNSYGEATPPDGSFLDVDTGDELGCAIRTDHTVVCWGGTQGDGYPVRAPAAPGGRFTAIEVGGGMACGIREDATVTCWGFGWDRRSQPFDGTYTSLASGFESMCGIRTDGSSRCWADSASDVPSVPGDPFVELSLGWPNCGLRPDGTVTCWGETAGVAVTGTFTAISGTCGLHTDGTLACWQSAFDTDDNGTPLPAIVPPTGRYTALDDGCAIRTDSRIVCFGRDGVTQVAMPVASITSDNGFVTGPTTLRWSGSGPWPIATYDVSLTRSPVSTAVGRLRRWRSMTTSTSAVLDGPPGTKTCFQVRAHDARGMVSAWGSGFDCMSFPLDDRATTRSAGWSAIRGDRYYRGTALRTSMKGATLRARVAPMKLAIVATTCPTCGSIRIDDRLTLSLQSPTRVDRALLEVNLCSEEDGCPDEPYPYLLTIRVITRDKPVIIDGIAVG